MTEETEGKIPTAEMVVFLKDGTNYGYNVRPGFAASVYAPDLEFLAANGVINWKPRRPKTQHQSVLVLNKRKRKR